MRLAIALLSLLALNGCSFLFAQGPPPDHESKRYFDCNSNAAAPATDMLSAASDILMIVLFNAGSTNSSTEESRDRAVFAAVFGTAAAVYLASGVYGIVVCSKCSQAKQALEKRLNESDASTARHIEELERRLRESSKTSICGSDKDCKADRICVQGTCVALGSGSAPAPSEPTLPVEAVPSTSTAFEAPPAPASPAQGTENGK